MCVIDGWSSILMLPIFPLINIFPELKFLLFLVGKKHFQCFLTLEIIKFCFSYNLVKISVVKNQHQYLENCLWYFSTYNEGRLLGSFINSWLSRCCTSRRLSLVDPSKFKTCKSQMREQSCLFIASNTFQLQHIVSSWPRVKLQGPHSQAPGSQELSSRVTRVKLQGHKNKKFKSLWRLQLLIFLFLTFLGWQHAYPQWCRYFDGRLKRWLLSMFN